MRPCSAHSSFRPARPSKGFIAKKFQIKCLAIGFGDTAAPQVRDVSHLYIVLCVKVNHVLTGSFDADCSSDPKLTDDISWSTTPDGSFVTARRGFRRSWPGSLKG